MQREEAIRRLNLIDAVSVYCDGGVISDGVGIPSRSLVGGMWAWVALDVAGERLAYSSGLLLRECTNNMSEFYAVLQALEALPAGWAGTIFSDSSVAVGRFTRGWTLRGIPQAWVQRGAKAIERAGAFRAVLLQGHPNGAELQRAVGKGGLPVSRWQVWADSECQRLAREYLQPLSWDDPVSSEREGESMVNTANQDLNIPVEKCRSCGASIYWLANETTQKKAPIDRGPSAVDSVVILDERTYRVLRATERETYAGPRYTNHFQTCEHSKQWSRGGR